MNKLAKLVLSSTIVLGTAIGANAVQDNGTSTEAHATTKPWYNYTGYTASQGNFVLDQNFINAVKFNNFTINGYTMDGKVSEKGSKFVYPYDQKIAKTSKNTGSVVYFKLGKSVTSKQIIDKYGKPEIDNVTEKTGDYRYHIGYSSIDFYVKDGYAYKAMLDTHYNKN
jgi:hypothetical protein